jgi:4-amino-4-deoxy-L-arabinose transferase-like glycosyltransferase
MQMTYLGALKAWIYAPVFAIFGTGIFALRLPMLLAGAAGVWLFFLLLRRIAGDRAAVVGCGLLAVDSIYLLTLSFDWGPVALQHLLLLGGMLLLIRFHQQRSHWSLAGGFFLFGLALWDKALAIWMLSGLGIAGLLTFPRQILRAITPRRAAIAVFSFVIGALPLLIYNAENRWQTFAGNFQRDPAGISGKARMLLYTADGGGMFGWMINEDWQTPAPHHPAGALPRASAAISDLAGHPRRQWFLYAFFLALLLMPVVRGNALRAMLFALIAMAVAWVQMAITANTGGSLHHTILLWPLPEMVVAAAFACASQRLGRFGKPVLAAVLTVLMISGALVINEYYTVMRRNGGGQMWTDALFNLSDYIGRQPAKTIFSLDWAILDPLRLLHRGRLPLAVGNDPVNGAEKNPSDRAMLLRMISDPANLFIGHTKEYEFFPGVTPKLLAFGAEAGYRGEQVAVIPDRYGRKVYEVYRFVK